MELQPNEFIEPILKDHVPWTMVPFKGVPLFDLLVNSWEFDTVTPAPWTLATAASLCANYAPRYLAQSSLLRFASPPRGPCGPLRRASWLPGVFLLCVFHASSEAMLIYRGHLVFLGPCFCRRAECIGQFASPLDVDMYLQPWFLHRSGRRANLVQNVFRSQFQRYLLLTFQTPLYECYIITCFRTTYEGLH